MFPLTDSLIRCRRVRANRDCGVSLINTQQILQHMWTKNLIKEYMYFFFYIFKLLFVTPLTRKILTYKAFLNLYLQSPWTEAPAPVRDHVIPLPGLTTREEEGLLNDVTDILMQKKYFGTGNQLTPEHHENQPNNFLHQYISD